MQTRVATYLDANASQPLKREVIEALVGVTDRSAFPLVNPSSSHALGRRARRLFADAREAIAASIGADAEQLLLTSSGSEANQFVIRSLLQSALEARGAEGPVPHWILCAGDHDSVLQLREWWAQAGGQYAVLPLLPNGQPDLSNLWGLIRPETALLSLCWVNNETGVVADLAMVHRTLQSFPWVKLHLDAVQAWGKLPLAVEQLGASAVTLSGHKIGAPAGTGIIWLNRGVRLLHPLIFGKQEKGRRGGTENLLGWIGVGAAAQTLTPAAYVAKVEPLRQALERQILARIPGVRINGEGAPRVANTTSLTFEGVRGEGLVMALDLEGYCASVGSACASGVQEPSHVLLAMGYTPDQALGSVRVSLWEGNTEDDVRGFVDALERVVSRIRGSKPLNRAVEELQP